MNDKRLVPGGFYLSFDGIDYCGKSTQIGLLTERLGEEFLLYEGREPGSTPVAERVRDILLDRGTKADATTELLLYNAARSSLFGQEVIPALVEGRVAVMDRSFDATSAYQGYAGEQDLGLIIQLAKVATRDHRPDLTFILDINLEERARRMREKVPDRLEAKDQDYQQRVIDGFRAIAKGEPERCVLLDGTRTIEDLHEEIYATAKARIEQAIAKEQV